MGRQNARLFVRRSSFSHPNSRINEFIFHHPFNCSLQILCPISLNSDPIRSLFSDPLVFNSCRAKLPSFISEEFSSMYTDDSDRKFYALSVGSHSDLGDSFCVCNNVLRLSLTTESYSRLGLTGRRSSQVKDRYIVDIKLNGDGFKPGHHFFDRVQTMFRRFDQEFLVWMLCLKKDTSVNLDTRLGGFTDVKSERVTFSSRVIKPAQIPHFHRRDSSDHHSSSYLQNIQDWFGALAMGINDYPLADPDKSAKYQIHCQEWKGMISSDQVKEAVDKCKKTLSEKALPWIAVMASGFKDTPLSFAPPCQEEGSRSCDFGKLCKSDHAVVDDVSGENDYLLLILPPDRYSLFVNIGSGDNFKTL